MIASMVFSIISAVLAGVLIILSSITLSMRAPNSFENSRISYWKYVAPFYIPLILVGLVMMATSILASFKICLVTCCCGSGKDEVYYLKTREEVKQSYEKYQPPPPYNVV